ncbi:Gfo/Idh/MocA family protein [Ornithinibacillus bavariensis]|uniref:Gfo/Idh/MocA family protein n=1 Tax=Ornithinibacillus bavariensis TaxID=545502 RepID=UPI000EBE2D27|nr:gfo/Idh/MocA family oxidoreductase [Ornithinibacillus sp.]
MKLGTIGTNWITSAFIESAKEHGELTLQSVYSRTGVKAKDFAERHGAKEYFTSLEEFVKSDIDCVYIASPNSLHFEQAMLCLRHKKHVICEKPIFSNRKELDQAFAAAEENGVFLIEAMRNIHMPGFKVLRENLEKAGKLRGSVLNYSKYSSRYDNVRKGEEPNIFSLNYSGGALVDLGVYPLALAVALFGEPVDATYYPSIIRTGVDGGGTLVLRYSDFICTILCSKIATSYNPSEIQGEEGTFVIDDLGTLSTITWMDPAGEHILTEKHQHLDMYYEVESFVNMIKNNDQLTYKRLKEISQQVLAITEKVRKDCGIIYAADR